MTVVEGAKLICDSPPTNSGGQDHVIGIKVQNV